MKIQSVHKRLNRKKRKTGLIICLVHALVSKKGYGCT